MSEQQVHAELRAMNGNKAKLMQKYSNELQELVKPYGGNMSDVPVDPEHPAHKLQNKIRILGRLQ